MVGARAATIFCVQKESAGSTEREETGRGEERRAQGRDMIPTCPCLSCSTAIIGGKVECKCVVSHKGKRKMFSKLRRKGAREGREKRRGRPAQSKASVQQSQSHTLYIQWAYKGGGEVLSQE